MVLSANKANKKVNREIDINCDLGEGCGNDSQLMPLLDSCNIACGGHFGDEHSMRATIQLAKQNKVKIGAHPSFPDKENFGRKVLDMPLTQLQNAIYQQLCNFQQICTTLNVKMHHIKLHGALYNLAAKDIEIASMVLNVFAAVVPDIRIYVPYSSAIATIAEDYFPISYEAFIDRRYQKDLSLVPRNQAKAVINCEQLAWQQMQQILASNSITCITGETLKIKADTFCLHGDAENSLQMLKYIRQCLSQ